MKLPEHNPNPWHPSCVEDFNRAKSDEERRAMLISFGYDEAHKEIALRLFPELQK